MLFTTKESIYPLLLVDTHAVFWKDTTLNREKPKTEIIKHMINNKGFLDQEVEDMYFKQFA